MPIALSRKANSVWKRFSINRTVTVAADRKVSVADRFFLMGSCFAEEIRLALDRELGAGHVVPDYRQLVFDPARASVDELPERNHLNTYNAFSVLQEIEMILGLWAPAADDYWQLGDRFQCPYRRLVTADSPELLAEIRAGLDRILRAAFDEADHFVFTFGMTEIFINHASGKVASQKPGYGGGGGKSETDYHRATFAENLDAILRLTDLILARKPEARIFMTVSPVPLKKTFSSDDIFVANTLSKATLRAVLAEAAAARPAITYFPSYDAVISEGVDAFEADGRHVRRPVVEEITRTFVDCYFRDRGPAAAAQTAE